MATVIKLLLNAAVAWVAGIIFVTANLYFSDNGGDFTTEDLMGFGIMSVVGSGLLMILVYLPGLYTLKKRLGGLRPRLKFALLTGVLCNLPVFLFLGFLINRKMSPTEAVGFMVAFLVIGVCFGLGFTFVANTTHSSRRSFGAS